MARSEGGPDDDFEVLPAITDFLVPQGDGTPSNAELIRRAVAAFRDVTGADLGPADAAVLRSPRSIQAFLLHAAFEEADEALVALVQLELPDADDRGAGGGLRDRRLAERRGRERCAAVLARLSIEDRLLLALTLLYRRFVRYRLVAARSATSRLAATLTAYWREVEPLRLSSPILHGAPSAHNLRAALEDASAAMEAAIEERVGLLEWPVLDLDGFVAVLGRPARSDLVDTLVERTWAHLFADVEREIATVDALVAGAAGHIDRIRKETRDAARLDVAVRSLRFAILFSVLALVVSLVSALGTLVDLGLAGWLDRLVPAGR